MSKHDLTAARLRELVNYNPDTGLMTWKISRNQKALAGTEVGHQEAKGYRSACIDGKDFKVHRLAWLYVYGQWPKNQIDHLNQIKDDNRIVNLRDVTNSQNQLNIKIKSNNTSGLRGVHFDSRAKTWRAQISRNGVRQTLGSFDTKEKAATARATAEVTI